MNLLYNHPKPLKGLFFTEMWERFSYYGMRAILVLYLKDAVINGGFGYTIAQAKEIMGIFAGLVYLTPIFGGLFADKYIGQRRAVYVGGILMALGHLGLTMSEQNISLESRTIWLAIGLGLLVMGNGFFKPNISTMVGKLYPEDQVDKKEAGFTIFYMGINLGALLGGIVSSALGENYGWSWGLGAATVGMLAGLIWFWWKSGDLEKIGLAPKKLRSNDHVFNITDWQNIGVWTATCIVVVVALIFGWNALSEQAHTILLWILGGAFIIGLLSVVGLNTKGGTEWSRMGAFFFFFFVNIFFWVGFDQAAGNFVIFADEYTNRSFFGLFDIPAGAFSSLNPLLILILAPLFSMMWMRLSTKNLNPNKPLKFSYALVLLGIGFILMAWSNSIANPEQGILVSPLWLFGVYLFHTMGELCLSPIGLSMVTDLAPKKIASLMMGIWFTSFSIAAYVAQVLDEKILKVYYPDINIYVFLIYTSFGAALFIFVLSPLIKKLMKGVH